ncbi:MFS transporter [Lentilactobacillus raoultii]|uniref:MFS transporter n=1 Tax=Lentilactobacillus raoultii TaxID=1987503 RepID=A0ABW3PKQ4_9LACO|nr:MFS transporter [Lentilactobacillus raoultii]
MTRSVSLKLYLSIVATGLMAFCGVLIETAMNVTFPTLMKQFGVNTATIQWLTTGYLLIVSIFVPISGFLKRRFTTKQLFLTANLTFLIGLLICSFTNNFTILLVGRLIQGAGTGVALPLMFNIILEQAPLDKLGFLMGIGTLVTAIAPAIGPTYGGLLVGLDWHYIFRILLVLIVISLILGIGSITQVTQPKHVKLDFSSWLLIAIFFAGAILAFNQLASSITMALAYGVIGVAGLILFIFRTKHTSNALVNLGVFKSQPFTLHLTGFLIMQIINVGAAFVLPNYLQLVNRVSSLEAGILLLPGAAIGAALAPVSGKLYDALGPSKPIKLGLTIQLIGVVLLLVTALTANTWIVLTGYVFVMLGTGFAMGNIMTNGLAQISKAQSIDGNAVFNTLQQFSGALGTAIISLIMSLAQVATNEVHSTAVGAQHDFLLLVILELLAILMLLVGLRRGQSKKTTD